jgi:hypothetical protein
MTCVELRTFNNKTVSIAFLDGEVVTARLTCLNDSCDEVLVDILITNLPGRYRDPHTCSYSVAASEIVCVTEISESDKSPELIPMKQSEEPLTAALETAETLQVEYKAAA